MPLATTGTVMFTIATAGYSPFVLNLHTSLNKIGLADKLVVFCLDPEAYQVLSGAGLSCRLHRSKGTQPYCEIAAPGFARIVAHKYEIARTLLERGLNVLYVDGDIVFLRDPLPLLSRLVLEIDSELLMQREPESWFNTGFWLARPSEPLLDLLDVVGNAAAAEEIVEDQVFFNEALKKGEVKVTGLDPRLFATGKVIFDNPGILDIAYILHFNCVVGRKAKIAKMQQHGATMHPDLGEAEPVPLPQLTGTGADDIRAYTPDRLRGFHEIERHGRHCFRWASPSAGIRLTHKPGDYQLEIEMAPLLHLWGGRLSLTVDGKPASNQSFGVEDGCILLKISRSDFGESDEHWIGLEFDKIDTSNWAGVDPRALGAPIFGLRLSAAPRQ